MQARPLQYIHLRSIRASCKFSPEISQAVPRIKLQSPSGQEPSQAEFQKRLEKLLFLHIIMRS